MSRLPALLLGDVRAELRRVWVFVPQHALHNVEALAVLRQLGAACVSKLVHGVRGLAGVVEQRGHKLRERVSTTKGCGCRRHAAVQPLSSRL